MALLVRELGDLNLEFVNHILSLKVLDALQNTRQDLVSLRDDASADARVAVVGTHTDFQVKVEAATQTVGDCERVLCVGARIEANDQVGVADVCLVVFEVVKKIIDLTFFAAFDGYCAPRVAHVQRLKGFDREQCAEKGVSIV